MLLHGKEQLALENTLRLAEEIGMLEGTAEQIIDSTPMLGAAATQDTVRLVGHGVKKLIDAVAAIDAGAGRRLDDGLEFDYAQACFGGQGEQRIHVDRSAVEVYGNDAAGVRPDRLRGDLRG